MMKPKKTKTTWNNNQNIETWVIEQEQEEVTKMPKEDQSKHKKQIEERKG